MIKRFKELFSVLALALLAQVVPNYSQAAFTDLESGSVNSSVGGGMFATDGWGGGAFQLSWDIDFDPVTGQFRYVYTISNPLDTTPPTGELVKNLSHWLLEVSSTFTNEDWLGGTTPDSGPETFEAQADGDPGSNPGLPSDLYGFKYSDLTVTLITLREPIDGSFYAKDGSCNQNFPCPGFESVFAYNTGLEDPINGAFIRVPDTGTTATTATTATQVPEPYSLFLFGSGLILLGGVTRGLGHRKQ